MRLLNESYVSFCREQVCLDAKKSSLRRARECRQGVNGALFALLFRGRPLKTFALQVLQNADSTNILELCDYESESPYPLSALPVALLLDLGRLPAVTPSISLLHGG